MSGRERTGSPAGDAVTSEALDGFAPRFRYGTIYPAQTPVRLGPNYQLYRIVPLDVIEVAVVLGIEDYRHADVEKGISNFLPCVDLLAAQGVQRMVLGGVPVSAQLGRHRVRDLLEQARARSGVPCDAPIESVIAAMRFLGLRTMSIGSRWAPELNDAVVAYLADGGIDVVSVTSRGQWGQQAFTMTLDEGMRAALDVGREAGRAAVEMGSEAIFVPGGAALSLHVIPIVEHEFGKPVLTNLNAEVWDGLVHTGIVPPVSGWGRLLASA